jgi:hypothetical protein
MVNTGTTPTVTASTSASLVCTGGTVTLTGAGASSYAWSGGITNGVAFAPASSNVYTVTGSDSSGCSSTATVNVTVSNCTGMPGVAANALNMSVYPNPFNEEFTVSTNGAAGNNLVEIFDHLGKLVYTEKIISPTQVIKTNVVAGVYFIKLVNNNHVVSTQKLISK